MAETLNSEIKEIINVTSIRQLNDLFRSTTYVTLEVFGDWCRPGKAITPFVEKWAAQHSVAGILRFARVNIDMCDYQVPSNQIPWDKHPVPSFLVFRDGRKIKIGHDEAIHGADLPKIQAAIEDIVERAKKYKGQGK